jgi:hypothetical protein
MSDTTPTPACDDVRLAALQGRAPDASATAHLAGCTHCAGTLPRLLELGRHLRATTPVPPPTLHARILRAATPALADNAARVAWRPVARALAAALLPLPFIVTGSVYVLHGLYALLATILPATLSLYLVLNYAGLLALLAALTYGAIPLLAIRQARPSYEVAHG